MKDQNVREYLAAQRDLHKRPTVVAFPTLYPREVLTALDLCAWEVWSAHASDYPDADAGRLQGYLCPTVRGAQAFLSGAEHGAIAAIVPHTCDSLQGLATIGKHLGGASVPVLSFRHPRGSDRPASRRYLRAELESFVCELEKVSQRTLDPARLTAAIELHRRLEALVGKVLRGRPWLTMSDADLYAVLRRMEWKHPEDMVVELEAVEAQIDRSVPRRKGVPLVFSGMVPEPSGLFETLEDAGAYVAGDDYAGLGRRLPAHDGPIDQDPIGSVVERLLLMPPCPTRALNSSLRIDRLRALASEAGAGGVVLHTVKFCEPELFDVPLMRRGLEQAGLKVLHIETELEDRVTGQIATRLEAFVEMLSDERSA